MKNKLVKFGVIVSLGALLISCGENTEEAVQSPAAQPAVVQAPAVAPAVTTETTFIPSQGPMAGIDANYAQQFQNLPVQGSNGYSGNYGETYSMQYQRQGNYNYQYSNQGDCQALYNSGCQQNRSDPYSNTFYLDLDWQENPYSGRTSFGGSMGFY